MSERLHKLIADSGVASRKEAEAWLKQGQIRLNGEVVNDITVKADPERDKITVNGRLLKVKLPPKVYWLLNKPDKVLTSRSADGAERATIYDLPMVKKSKFLVSPVGRLDFRTEGLLLLTNDGELSFRLCKPEYHVPREYQVLVARKLTQEELGKIKKGIALSDGPLKNVKIQFVHGEKLGKTSGAWYLITVHEGRNRVVRRIFEYFDTRVLRLIRIGFGDLRLTPELKPGSYRQLTSAEIKQLKKQTKLIEKSTNRASSKNELRGKEV